MDRGWVEKAKKEFGEICHPGCALRDYTSFKIGGPASLLIEADGYQTLVKILCFCNIEKIRWRVIGKGTNLVVSDEGFDGVIILLGAGFKRFSLYQNGRELQRIFVGAGLGLGRFARQCCERELSGCEFCAGIPGTVGGAVVMNAGAWGGEMSQIITGVEMQSATKRFMVNGGELNFSYRKWPAYATYSRSAVITGVEVALGIGKRKEIQKKMKTLLAERKCRQSIKEPNAGSFFRNPADGEGGGKSAGQLIDEAGLKGYSVGDAAVSEYHANFLVNRGRAKSEDVVHLMQYVVAEVKKQSGITLEPEVHFL